MNDLCYDIIIIKGRPYGRFHKVYESVFWVCHLIVTDLANICDIDCHWIIPIAYFCVNIGLTRNTTVDTQCNDVWTTRPIVG